MNFLVVDDDEKKKEKKGKVRRKECIFVESKNRMFSGRLETVPTSLSKPS